MASTAPEGVLEHLVHSIMSPDLINYNITISFGTLQQILLQVLGTVEQNSKQIKRLETEMQKRYEWEERASDNISTLQEDMLLKATHDDIRKESRARDHIQTWVGDQMESLRLSITTELRHLQASGLFFNLLSN
jgi:hypothetical protein